MGIATATRGATDLEGCEWTCVEYTGAGYAMRDGHRGVVVSASANRRGRGRHLPRRARPSGAALAE